MATSSTATSKDTVRSALQAAQAAADAVIAAAKAGAYTMIAAGEQAINDVRTQLHTLMDQVGALWGADGNATVRALRDLGARLLDLRALITDTDATATEVLTRNGNLISLAVTWYGDFSRWTEIAALNPHLPHAGRIVAGTSVVRRVR